MKYAVSQRDSIKDALKLFSKFSDKRKKQSSGGVLSKDVFKKFAKFTEKNYFSGVSFLTKLQAGRLQTLNWQKQPLEIVFKTLKMVFLKILKISQKKPVLESLFNKVGVLRT